MPSMAFTPRKQTGFTIIELMVVVAMTVILATIAVPSFTDTVRNNTVIARTNALLGALNLARAEAIAVGKVIVVCATDTPNANVPACGNDWSKGWVVYEQESKKLLKSGDGLTKVALTGGAQIFFNKLGRSVKPSDVNAVESVNLSVKPETCKTGVNTSVAININTSGRIATVKGTCS